MRETRRSFQLIDNTMAQEQTAIAAATFFLATFLPGALPTAAADAPQEVVSATNRRIEDTAPPENFRYDLAQALSRFQARTPSRDLAASPLRINLVFHVLSGAAQEGDVSDAILQNQLTVLNDAYRSSGL